MTTVVFSHGKESGPWGTKIRAMSDMCRRMGCATDSIDYRGISDPAKRVDKLVQECASVEDRLVLVGSSMGGHVATAAAEAVGAAGVFVLAPAFFMVGYEDLTPPPPNLPLSIVHGWNDDIVPAENSIRFARECGANLHLVDGDHRLIGNIDEINEYLKVFIERISE